MRDKSWQDIVPVGVVREVERFRPDGEHQAQGCVYLSNALCVSLGKRGYNPRLQAGSAFWRIADESAAFPWFGYEFECETAEQFRALCQTIQSGALPELHCWVALPDAGIIIDPTYGDQPVQARNLQGLEWQYDRPQRGDWKVIDSDDSGVDTRYIPDLKAIQLAHLALGYPMPTQSWTVELKQVFNQGKVG